MDSLDYLAPESLITFADYSDNRANTYPQSSMNPSNWPFSLDNFESPEESSMGHQQHLPPPTPQQLQKQQQQQQQHLQPQQQQPHHQHHQVPPPPQHQHSHSHSHSHSHPHSHHEQQQQQQQHHHHHPSQQSLQAAAFMLQQSRRNPQLSEAAPNPLQTTPLGLGYAQNMAHGSHANVLNPDWQFHYPSAAQAFTHEASYEGAYAGGLHTSPVDYMPVSAADLQNGLAMSGAMPSTFMTMAGPMDSMNSLAYPLNDYQNELLMMGIHHAAQEPRAAENVQSSVPGSSPTGSYLEVRSLPGSDHGWTTVDFPVSRHSSDNYAAPASNAVFNPGQTLHIRTDSGSSLDDNNSAQLSTSSYEEVQYSLYSPQSDGWNGNDYVQANLPPHHHMQHPSDSEHDCSEHSHETCSISPSPVVSPTASSTGVAPASTAVAVRPAGLGHRAQQASTSSISSSASSPISPPVRRRKSPTNASTKNTKAVIKKTPSPATKKDGVIEKKVGRRRGPLRPDQRQQAHEIRKLRACLRCKFLKKTCDKGDPCGGCRPSHARLWQVPCTRIDIKDIGFFMKDWKADYERHISLGFSIGNIKGFSNNERLLYITHGYGHYLPINAREIYVRDDTCFGMDWVERVKDPQQFEVPTAKLSAGMEGVSTSLLSDYLDRHLDKGFEYFVDELFEGTPFLTEMLKTAHRYYQKSKSVVIRKALKLVLAYNLTLHVTMVEGLPEDEAVVGRIDDEASKFSGKTMAPVMINFQVKCALADMWRELQKEILEELSAMYSSVYSGEKLKNWPTIFMLAAILLAVWEEMQFDAHYRTPDEAAVNKFCNDMESTPVGVIVGLFQAISQKLPSFMEWDTRKHHHLLGSNQAVCDALTEIKGHVTKHEQYLRLRVDAKFDRDDFDCLSNKFLSRLVIRAN